MSQKRGLPSYEVQSEWRNKVRSIEFRMEGLKGKNLLITKSF